MNHTAALLSLATSVPPHQFHQRQILEAASAVMTDRYPQFETLSSLFANTGIRHRYGVKPIEWYLERRGWPERTQAFLEGAEALFVDVARKALASADLSAGDVDTVVTICSTGIATPTLEARVASAHGLSRRRLARAGVWAGMRRRRIGPVDCRAAGAIAARHQRAAGRDRALHARGAPRRTDQGQYRRRQPVRRRRRGGRAARRRWRCDQGRGVGRKALAGYARHHGLERRSRKALA